VYFLVIKVYKVKESTLPHPLCGANRVAKKKIKKEKEKKKNLIWGITTLWPCYTLVFVIGGNRSP